MMLMKVRYKVLFLQQEKTDYVCSSKLMNRKKKTPPQK